MRTTLIFDDDMQEQARLVATKTRKPVNVVLDEAPRVGLTGLKETTQQPLYATARRALGLRDPGTTSPTSKS